MSRGRADAFSKIRRLREEDRERPHMKHTVLDPTNGTKNDATPHAPRTLVSPSPCVRKQLNTEFQMRL